MSQHLGNIDDFSVMQKLLSVSGQFIVDAGCGSMELSRKLSEGGASVLAIDPDPVQAEQNRQADIIPNVGFVETTADNIPVEASSVDGIIFSYSLHHVPRSDYPAVFSEVLRILKPNGFLYALEPVADGALNAVMSLFHDEKQVRADAQHALQTLAVPSFVSTETFTYSFTKQYQSFDEFADYFASRSFNADYTEEQVRSDAVARAFEQHGAPTQYCFERPMHVTLLRGAKPQPTVS